ncbi:MAG TPA: phosphatase PAP2 family protein [Polyangia bacterium]|jgi:membrane-associated phospholipid phosphatase|nr:phosphatase PAP2 family protein [Polyangia bacterium]
MLEADPAGARFEDRTAGQTPGQIFEGRLRGVGPHLAIAAVYLLVLARLGLSGPLHWIVAAIYVASWISPPRISSVLLDALPFALFGAAYDLLRIARRFVVARGVEVWRPYWFDLVVFGVGPPHNRRTLNELFVQHHWPLVDFITGLAYLSYIYAVLGFAVFLALVDRTAAGARRIRALGWTFFGVNAAASLTYLLLPVAPPWYAASHGFGPVDPTTPASPAALVRWDELVGVPYFHHFYARASDIFGSMPSMHCAYPMILFLFGLELRRWRFIVALGAFQLLMCFSAVYLQHHYVSDVIIGMLYALLGYSAERLLSGRDAVPAAP